MKNYTIKDLYLASVLFAQSKNLQGLHRVGKDYWFQFEDYVSCEQVISDYWKGKVFIDAKALVESIKNLKNMIFSEIEKERFVN